MQITRPTPENHAKALKTIAHVMEKAPEPALQLKVPLKVDAKAAANWEAAH